MSQENNFNEKFYHVWTFILQFAGVDFVSADEAFRSKMKGLFRDIWGWLGEITSTINLFSKAATEGVL